MEKKYEWKKFLRGEIMGIGILIVFVVSLVYKGRNRLQKALIRYKDKLTKKKQYL